MGTSDFKTGSGTVYHVDQNHPDANDENTGSLHHPFKTISRAAFIAQPGDTVMIHQGVYRERVSPERGGTEGNPITYIAVPGEEVYVKGSEVWNPDWAPDADFEDVYRAKIDHDMFKDFNPYHLGFKGYKDPVRPDDSQVLKLTRGQIFVDGEPLTQVTRKVDLDVPGTWLVSGDGEEIYVHFPYSRANEDSKDRFIEITARHRIFAPERQCLGYIHVIGIHFEHASINHPTPQIAAVSTRGGHHWLIEDCTIRHSTTVGLDIGCEWGIEDTPEVNDLGPISHNGNNPGKLTGYHIVRDNTVSDNGLCGIMGIRTWGCQIVGNTVERNNCLGFRTWEWGGIKVHLFFDGLIEGNLVRDNDCFGIWLDNQYKGSRVTRNVILNNQVAGLMVEIGHGPIMVDNNVIALTRQGDGIYCHDASGMTFVHNLIYGNGNYGIFVGIATDRPTTKEKSAHSSNVSLFNNLILGNRAAQISWPYPWERAANNFSDNNIVMGAGELMAATETPIFLYNDHHGHINREEMAKAFSEALDRAEVPEEDRPNMKLWKEHTFLNLEQWRLFSGNDKNSKVMNLSFEMLSSKTLEFIVRLRESLEGTACKPIEGIDYDFNGNPMPEENILPGPFQYVKPGEHRFLLWPLRKKSQSIKGILKEDDAEVLAKANKDWSSNGI